MREIIRVENASYSRYEELLTKRDELRKKAFQYYRAYIREFGDLMLEVFQIKIECIKKKKTIEFYQRALNQGSVIDRDALDDYLVKELAEYQKQLNDMIKDNEASKDFDTISEIELLKIKSIYRKLAKLIHPDINGIAIFPVIHSSSFFILCFYSYPKSYNTIKEKPNIFLGELLIRERPL